MAALPTHFLAAQLHSSTNATVTPTCNDIENCRTRWDIIWSCLTTVFLCTWVAVHPNIPEPVDNKELGLWQRARDWSRRFIRERVLLFVVALLVPDYMLAWAIRQRLVAYSIVKRNERLGLTTVHGFFIIMGGCHHYKRLYRSNDQATQTIPSNSNHNGSTVGNQGSHIDDEAPESQDVEAGHAPTIDVGPDTNPGVEEAPCDLDITNIRFYKTDGTQKSREDDRIWRRVPVHPLDRKDVIWLIENGKFEMPTEEEIVDKSKNDWLAKGLVIMQTLWFVSQCTARAVENLAITELEIVTLAYTIINIGIYLAWWRKPYNVTEPLRIFATAPRRTKDLEQYAWELDCLGEPKWERKISIAWKYVLGDVDAFVHLGGLKRIPTFYAGNFGGKSGDTRITIANGITLGMGLVFGAIHCIAWSFQFSSRTEQILWRLSAVIIVGLPFSLLVIGAPISQIWPEGIPFRRRNIFERVFAELVTYVIIIGFPILAGMVYVAARVTVLVLAFVTLRALPPDAYKTVQWAILVPHL